MSTALASLGHAAAAAATSRSANRRSTPPSPTPYFTPAVPRRSASLGLGLRAAQAVADGMMSQFGDGMGMPAFKFVRPDVPLLSSDSEEEDGGGLTPLGPVSAWPRRGGAATADPFLPPRSALERASYETNKSLSGGGASGGSSSPRKGLLRLGFFGL